MSYSIEIFNQIKQIRAKIENCEDPYEAVLLQTELVELLENTLNDEKFKKDLIQRNQNAGNN